MAKAKAAKSAGTALVKWDKELAAFAQKGAAVVDSIASGGNFISFKGGKITYKGAEVPGGKMNVVVVVHGLENSFFTGKYDPNNPAPPDCFALGFEASAMCPHENSGDPQSDACKGCPKNEWASADTGRGKACKNLVRIGLLSQSDLEDASAIPDAEMAIARVPVTSTKAWAGYVRNLQDTLNRPPFAVITEVEVKPDADTQFKVSFKLVETIEDGDVIGALIAGQEKWMKELMAPYPKPDTKPAKKAAPAKKRKF